MDKRRKTKSEMWGGGMTTEKGSGRKECQYVKIEVEKFSVCV